MLPAQPKHSPWRYVAGLTPGVEATLKKVVSEPARSKILTALSGSGSGRHPKLKVGDFLDPKSLDASVLVPSDAESLRQLRDLLKLDKVTDQRVVALYYVAQLPGEAS